MANLIKNQNLILQNGYFYWLLLLSSKGQLIKEIEKEKCHLYTTFNFFYQANLLNKIKQNYLLRSQTGTKRTLFRIPETANQCQQIILNSDILNFCHYVFATMN